MGSLGGAAGELPDEDEWRHELELFYRMNHAWRIVEDPSMKSARRRRAEGLPPLGDVAADEMGEPDSEEICNYLVQDHIYCV